jgi:hypothetical protein
MTGRHVARARANMTAAGMNPDTDPIAPAILGVAEAADSIASGMSPDAERQMTERVSRSVAQAVEAIMRTRSVGLGLLGAGLLAVGLLGAGTAGYALGERAGRAEPVVTQWGPMPAEVVEMVAANGVQGLARAWRDCSLVSTTNGGEACQLTLWRQRPTPRRPGA